MPVESMEEAVCKRSKSQEIGSECWEAHEHANTRKGYWRIAGSPILCTTVTNKYIEEMGLINCGKNYLKLRSL